VKRLGSCVPVVQPQPAAEFMRVGGVEQMLGGWLMGYDDEDETLP
jgi:hypothetical protein